MKLKIFTLRLNPAAGLFKDWRAELDAQGQLVKVSWYLFPQRNYREAVSFKASYHWFL
ncbi:MAG: hypothetical protein Q8O90_03025 [Elusimicrobiota bacterium]|nr:hypothetical protein [Elusimicrobiota bacterium]